MMLNKPTLLLFSILFCGLSATAQNYFQQDVNTKISVTLDDKKNLLLGFEEFSYKNNSTDTLRTIYIHLWPNAYKHDHTPFAEQQYANGKKDFYYAKEDDRGFIDSLSFKIDEEEVSYESDYATPDIAKIDLPKPLAPGASMNITTPFRVKIPIVFSRLGHTKQAYFISQWFPKPAVYDRKGWHPIPYLDLGEFYSEIGSYDVSITLPNNYVLLATGNCMTASENLWLDSLAALNVDSIKAHWKVKDSIPPSSKQMKTVRFTEHNIHDFAWFADKRFIVRKDSATTEEGNKVMTYTAFLPSYKKSWAKGNEYLKATLKYYGKMVGNYPYKTIKAVQGDMHAGGGMEYPTITVIDKQFGGDQTTIIHEAGHNWFYGMLASNERDHAWMDEGMNTFFEQQTSKVLNDTAKNDSTQAKGVNISINETSIASLLQASHNDMPIEQTSSKFKELNYGIDVYYKTASLVNWLKNYLGEKDFDSAMHDYFNTWKFKHPYPEDFKDILKRNTAKPVDWFFETLKSDRMYDFAIKKVKTNKDGVDVTIINKSGIAILPSALQVYRHESLIHTETPNMLLNDTVASTKEIQIIHLPDSCKDWTSIRIANFIPDGRTTNNYYQRNGLFHRSGLKLGVFTGPTNGRKYKFFVLPAVTYNYYDKFQPGILMHNLTWPETKLKFIVGAFSSSATKSINYAGTVGYDFYPQNGLFKNILLQADFKSFHNGVLNEGYNTDSTLFASSKLATRFRKLAPSLLFTFKENEAKSTVQRTLLLKGYYIHEQHFKYPFDVIDSLYKPYVSHGKHEFYGLVRYDFSDKKSFNPYNYFMEAQVGKSFLKMSLEGNIRLDFNMKNKALYVRGFAGKFFNLIDDDNSRYWFNTTSTGVNDYLYDEPFLGRNEQTGFGSNQIAQREGGFKIPTLLYSTPIGRTDDFLFAINLESDLPIKLPFRVFLDAGSFSNAKTLNPSGNGLLYDGGVLFSLKNVVKIYFPFFKSRDFADYQKNISGKTSVFDNVSFSIELNHFNWLKLPSEFFSLFGY